MKVRRADYDWSWKRSYLDKPGPGQRQEKTGKVIAIIPAKKDADLLLPHDVKQSHVKYDRHISIHERVLVAVPAGKSGQITHYYCPRKSVLEAQGN